jgi:putative transposase
MTRRRHTPEQIVRKLREADRLLGEGAEVPEVAKALEVSEATYHRWRVQYGGMKADDVKRLKELELENARLKRIVADQVLEVAALKEISKGRMKVKSGSRPLCVALLAGSAGDASRRRCARKPLGHVQPRCVRARGAVRG